MKKYLLLVLLLFPFLTLFAHTGNGPKGSISGNTGREGTYTSLEVVAFPNPVVNKRFTVEVNNHYLQGIRISNIAGIQVYEKRYTGLVNRVEVAIDNLPNGIYLLRVNADNNSSKTIKLLISIPR